MYVLRTQPLQAWDEHIVVLKIPIIHFPQNHNPQSQVKPGISYFLLHINKYVQIKMYVKYQNTAIEHSH